MRLNINLMPQTAIVLGICIPMAVQAQGIIGLSPEPPPPYASRYLGIDLSTSAVSINNDDISVGNGGFPGSLTLSRSYSAIGRPFVNFTAMTAKSYFLGFGQGSTHNLLSYFTLTRCSNEYHSRIIDLTAVVFGKAYHFSGGGCIASGPSTFVDSDDEGTSFRIVDPSQAVWTYELTTRDGIKVFFTDSSGYQFDTNAGRYARYASFPDGQFINFSYAASPTISGTVRLDTLVNSRGFGLKFNYKNRGPYLPNWPQYTLNDSSLITSINSFRKTSTSQINISTVYYTYDVTDFVVETFKNPLNGVMRYAYDLGRPTKIFYANNLSATPSVSISYEEGSSQVSTGWISVGSAGWTFGRGIGDNLIDVDWSSPSAVTDAKGNVTQFKFSDPTSPNPVSVTVTMPDGKSRFYQTIFCASSPNCPLYPNFQRAPSDLRDEFGTNWRFSYDIYGRILSTTNPEGSVSSIARDAKGNIKLVTIKPKPGSSLPDITSSVDYFVCTETNYRYCNKPTYTIDARGKRTDYTYDTASGGLSVRLDPAPDVNGVRPVTRYTYSNFSPAAGVVVPTGGPSAARLASIEDKCLASSVTATSIDFAYVCPGASRVRTQYNYVPSTPAAPSSYDLMSVVADADNTVLRTCFQYDSTGNVIAVTSPRGAVGACP